MFSNNCQPVPRDRTQPSPLPSDPEVKRRGDFQETEDQHDDYVDDHVDEDDDDHVDDHVDDDNYGHVDDQNDNDEVNLEDNDHKENNYEDEQNDETLIITLMLKFLMTIVNTMIMI